MYEITVDYYNGSVGHIRTDSLHRMEIELERFKYNDEIKAISFKRIDKVATV